jgi:hypothetical protein
MVAGPFVISGLPNPLVGIAVASLIFMVLYVGWLWAIATTANQKLEQSLKQSTKWMGLGLVYAAVYLLGGLLLFPSAPGAGQGLPGFIIPMHLLAMFAMFYALVFTAKRLVTLERKQQVSFFEYSGPFFLLWFFPIGVWFIQPRVNKLLGNNDA